MKGIAEQFATLDITNTNQYLMLAEIFEENEIRSIIEKRSTFDCTIKNLNTTIDDYKAYINFEVNLLQSILNANRLNKTITNLINTQKNKITNLFDTIVALYSNNLELWYTYINWLRTTATTTTTTTTTTKPTMTTSSSMSTTKTTTTIPEIAVVAKKLTTVNNNIINEIDKMLQCHGENDESWLYALQVLEDIEMDKSLLNSFIRRAVRKHPDNIKLHIKFLHIQLNGKWSENDMARLKESILAYEDAKRRIHGIDFYIMAIQLVMDYQFCHRTLLLHIIKDLTRKFTRNQRVWQFIKKLTIKKKSRSNCDAPAPPPPPPSADGDDDVGDDVENCPYTDKLLDKFDLCSNAFEPLLKENNKEIWEEYLSALHSLNAMAIDNAKQSGNEAINKAYKNAYENKCMSENVSLKYVEMLFDNKDFEKMETILESAIIEYPNSEKLWTYHLNSGVLINRNFAKTRQIFINACKAASKDYTANDETTTPSTTGAPSSQSPPPPPPPIIDLDNDDCVITDTPINGVVVRNAGGVYDTIGGDCTPGKQNIWLWLTYSMYLEQYVKNDEEIEQFFTVACNQRDPVFNTFKVIYLQRLSNNCEQFDKVRKFYKEISAKKPHCYDIFKLICSYESFQINVNVEEWRTHFKGAIGYFGTTVIDVWADYLKFEKRYGCNENLYDVMKLARSHLPKDLYQKLVSNLQKNEPNILKIINVCIQEKKKSK